MYISDDIEKFLEFYMSLISLVGIRIIQQMAEDQDRYIGWRRVCLV